VPAGIDRGQLMSAWWAFHTSHTQGLLSADYHDIKRPLKTKQAAGLNNGRRKTGWIGGGSLFQWLSYTMVLKWLIARWNVRKCKHIACIYNTILFTNIPKQLIRSRANYPHDQRPSICIDTAPTAIPQFDPNGELKHNPMPSRHHLFVCLDIGH